jgi:hypothetical protein
MPRLDFRQQITAKSITNLSHHSEKYCPAMSACTGVKGQDLCGAPG